MFRACLPRNPVGKPQHKQDCIMNQTKNHPKASRPISQMLPTNETRKAKFVLTDGLTPEEAVAAWERAVEKAGNRKITARKVKSAVQEFQLEDPTTNQWLYTASAENPYKGRLESRPHQQTGLSALPTRRAEKSPIRSQVSISGMQPDT